MSARVSTNSVFDDALAAIAPVVGLDNLQNTGRVTELLLGNGLVITEYLADLLIQAQTEVLFATCFWASSPSLSLLHDALIALNERARRDSRRVAVKIVFSSYSFQQKFLSLRGTRIWKRSSWPKLGLPATEMLDSLDVTVFGRFKKPFGIMHAKFLIIDRSSVILPSSNISWENWYELAVRLEGDIIQPFLSYFFHYFYPSRSSIPPLPVERRPILTSSAFKKKHSSLLYPLQSPFIPLAFLSRGPSFWGALPFARITTPTLFQIEAITRARRTIFIQTPNLTSRALLKALRQALRKEIQITLYLPRNMMVLESLITGWTTTARCVRKLQKFSKEVTGELIVEWFEGDERQSFVAEKSHIKFMVVDEECVVVGSSNCDRASACTSGEVNVAISDVEFAKNILSAVKRHQATGMLDV